MCRCSRRPLFYILSLLVAAAPAVSRAADAQLGDGENALILERDARGVEWGSLVTGERAADPADAVQLAAIDTAAKWATYRFDWGLEKQPGKLSDVNHEFGETLQTLRNGKEKGQKTAELFVKKVIPHALEVVQQGHNAVARVNAARILARVVEQNKDASETQADVLARLAGTNQGDLADALTTIIKDPAQIDAARFWAFRSLRLLLALPQPTPPTLPREKEEAALGAVVKFLQDRNKPFPPGAPQDEIDGYRYLRREALAALAQGRYPTLADKTRPTLVLLKVVARDGVAPEPRLDERVEAAVGVAHAQPEFDKDYQPDYAAHQLGLFVADFVAQYGQVKQGESDAPPTQPWRVEASRLIEALELMKAQAPKNAHVTRVADLCTELLKKVEKGMTGTSPFDLEQVLQAEASPGQSLYKGAADSTVKPANRKDEGATEKGEEKKDK